MIVVGFVIARGAGEDDENETTTTQAVETAPTETATTDTAPKPKPKPAVPLIRTRDGKLVGSVKRINADSGETVKFTVTSNVPEEVHLHGYDVEKPVGPGKPARYSFKADIEGIFEIELHGTAVEIGRLRVEP